MKIQKSLSVIFLFIASVINCEDGRAHIISIVQAYGRRMGILTTPNWIIEKPNVKIVDVILDTVEPSEIDDAKLMYNLPDSLIKQAKSVKVKEHTIKEYPIERSPYDPKDTYEISFNIAYKGADEKISLALITISSKAVVKKQKVTYNVKRCKKFLFFKSCHTEQQTVERDLNEAEIRRAINMNKLACYNKLAEVVNILKNGNKLIRNGSEIRF